MSCFRPIALFFMALMLIGCASLREWQCRPGEQRAINDLLYFGTAKPNGSVTAEEWEEFLRGTVTPRFPQGLTVWQASGQWQSADGSMAREASYVLNLVHPDDEAADAAVRAVILEYRSRFQQEAVLRVKTHSCATF
jgi:hypothetical protein